MHHCGCQLGDVASDFDTAGTHFAMYVNVQKAPAAHLRTLFADEARTVGAANEAVFHHKEGQGTSNAAGRRIFCDPELRCKHARIRSRFGRRKDENARRRRAVSHDLLENRQIQARSVDGRGRVDGYKDTGISRREKLAGEVRDELMRLKAEHGGTTFARVFRESLDRRRR